MTPEQHRQPGESTESLLTRIWTDHEQHRLNAKYALQLVDAQRRIMARIYCELEAGELSEYSRQQLADAAGRQWIDRQGSGTD